MQAAAPQAVARGLIGESGASVGRDGKATVRGGVDRGTDHVDTLDVSVRRRLCGPGSAAVGGLGQVLLVCRGIDRGTDRIHTRQVVSPESVHRRPIGEGEAAVGGDGQAAGRGGIDCVEGAVNDVHPHYVVAPETALGVGDSLVGEGLTSVGGDGQATTSSGIDGGSRDVHTVHRVAPETGGSGVAGGLVGEVAGGSRSRCRLHATGGN